ncbi:MAG: hypothetical protein H7Y04_11030, partial [Verrucomicrobia bacterium]|nr:hypothetical protein [Cytophagales bacterium]
MPKKTTTLLFLIFIFCSLSCSEPECGSTAVFPVMRIKFYKLPLFGRPTDVDTSVAFREIVGVLDGKEGSPIYVDTTKTQIDLPLYSLENQSTYIFRYKNLSEDRITFKYNR